MYESSTRSIRFMARFESILAAAAQSPDQLTAHCWPSGAAPSFHRPAELATSTLPNACYLYLPLRTLVTSQRLAAATAR